MIYYVIFVSAIFVSSVSQIILKKSAMVKKKTILEEYLNWRVILAYGLFLLANFVAMLTYRYVPLSTGAVLESSGYIFVAVLSFLFLREKCGKKSILGLLLIVLGSVIFNI